MRLACLSSASSWVSSYPIIKRSLHRLHLVSLRASAIPSASEHGWTANNAVNQTDPNDPSTFVKDPTLHKAFYGLAYTPENSQLPGCGNKLGTISTKMRLFTLLISAHSGCHPGYPVDFSTNHSPYMSSSSAPLLIIILPNSASDCMVLIATKQLSW